MGVLRSIGTSASLNDAWDRVRANRGAPGVDGITVAQFEARLEEELSALGADLRGGTYRPQPYRVVTVEKTSGGVLRLVIATVRDRVAQTAASSWLGKRLEPLLHPCSYAYRRRQSPHDALQKVCEYRDRGFKTVLRSDIAAFFDMVLHDVLYTLLGSAGVEEDAVALLDLWLGNGVAEEGAINPLQKGLPQGLPIAPLLANFYLTPFDRALVDGGWKLVRYADDFVVCCLSPESAAEARTRATEMLGTLGLTLKPEKTAVGSFESGFSFLGATFQGNELIPAVPHHPYEEIFHPPHKPPRAESAVPATPRNLLRTLYIQQQGACLTCHGGRLVVMRHGHTLLDLPAHHVNQIFLFGRIHLSAAAMAFCIRKLIPVTLFSGRGEYRGSVHGPDTAEFVCEQAQYRLLDDPARRLAVGRAIVGAKIAASARLLKTQARNHPGSDLETSLGVLTESRKRLENVETLDQLRGHEGNAAAAYFEGYARCFREDIRFTHRNRRPPTDPVNSLLSFGYTIVLHQVVACIAARRLDPCVGIFHESGRGHPALASDLLEEFRAPLVDGLVLALANRRAFTRNDFHLGQGTPQPCLLRDEARVRYLVALEEALAKTTRHAAVDHHVTYRQALDLQAGILRRFVLGEVATYTPMATGSTQ